MFYILEDNERYAVNFTYDVTYTLNVGIGPTVAALNCVSFMVSNYYVDCSAIRRMGNFASINNNEILTFSNSKWTLLKIIKLFSLLYILQALDSVKSLG